MIKQCRFSNSVKFFETEFLKLWKLNEYSNINEPALFVGVYNSNDIEIIKNHKSFKIVMILGADIPNMLKLKGLKDTIFASDKQDIIDLFTKNGMPVINQIIALKKFDSFTPKQKGHKIYCYINNYNEGNKIKHRLNLLEPAINYFGNDMFIFGTLGHSKNEVIEWYSKSFINIQLNPMAGFTSALEMAHMGRPSVSNNKAPFCINFTDHNDIIRIIERENNNNELNLSVYKYLDYSNKWLQV